ncbi:MAG: S-methyl-5-thioribose-1-phosphate isomerase [Phycisphaerae bacterium]|nr:S-methyl-5-thioribose-1-phosphate isomerase [Phycisphaerae bacterium]MDW8262657.1 S-methyl-5-thioribose-1-phosphate isomerase [Phycisphaerales bacterium]
MPPTLEWTGSSLRLLDQTRLPGETTFLDCTDEKMVWDAIRRLVVRGAPAIGVAAAYGAFLAIAQQTGTARELRARLREACAFLATARPTAVNLFRALERIEAAAERSLERNSMPEALAAPAAWAGEQDSSTASESLHDDPGEILKQAVLHECHRLREEDIDCCYKIGKHGLALLRQIKPAPPIRILTHCNAGALATCGIGTALAPVYLGHQQGIPFEVFASETRPLLQGARLTAWELSQAGIPVTVLCEGMAGSLMAEGRIDAILVGADRIAANGDVANKIGTLSLAIAARHFGVPLFVLAPTMTIDRSTPDGSSIPIEHRSPREVSHIRGIVTVPPMVSIYNPAFDVTPVGLISAIVTDQKIWKGVDTL